MPARTWPSTGTRSNATFAAWAAVAHVLPRYPELQGLGFAVLVRAADLPAYARA